MKYGKLAKNIDLRSISQVTNIAKAYCSKSLKKKLLKRVTRFFFFYNKTATKIFHDFNLVL